VHSSGEIECCLLAGIFTDNYCMQLGCNNRVFLAVPRYETVPVAVCYN
jgi:hypothetical protein